MIVPDTSPAGMKHYAILYVATLAVMAVLDLLWIGGIASNFYKSRIRDLEFHAAPAVLFYLLYACGIVIFANGSASAGWKSALLFGALFGFFAYATYDLTNLATLKGWSVLLVVVDVAWGTFITATAATSGLLIANCFRG